MIEYTLLVPDIEILYQGNGGEGLYRSYLRYAETAGKIHGRFCVCYGVNLVMKLNGEEIARFKDEETFKFIQDLWDFGLNMSEL